MSKSQLRQIARDNLGEVNPETEERYRKLAERILAAGGLATYTDVARPTWYEARAAIKHTLAVEIRHGLRRADLGDPSGHQDAIEAMLSLCAELEVEPPTFIRPRKSKRNGLGQLPHSWQECILSDLPPAHRLPWLVQHLSGCRTAELAEKGPVTVLAIEEENGTKALAFEVQGAKLGNLKGQRERFAEFDVTDGLALDLWRKTMAASDGLQVRVKNAGTYRNAVSRIGKRLGLKVSPYSARHAFAADAKADGVDPETLALSMGHQAEGTQQHYGLKRQAKGGRGCRLVGAKGTSPVRPKNRGQSQPFKAPSGPKAR